jgi:hypothetical protein
MPRAETTVTPVLFSWVPLVTADTRMHQKEGVSLVASTLAKRPPAELSQILQQSGNLFCACKARETLLHCPFSEIGLHHPTPADIRAWPLTQGWVADQGHSSLGALQQEGGGAGQVLAQVVGQGLGQVVTGAAVDGVRQLQAKQCTDR